MDRAKKTIGNLFAPVLEGFGFFSYKKNNYWKHETDNIWVLDFQTLNATIAKRIGCTKDSFIVNVGIYFTHIPQYLYPINKTEDGILLPETPHCHLISKLRKSIKQKELSDQHIWYVDYEKLNIDLVYSDVRNAITKQAIDWFNSYSSLENLLTILLTAEESDSLWGIGRQGSPTRNYLLGYTYLSMGKFEKAKSHLEKSMENIVYAKSKNDILNDIKSKKKM